MMATIVSLYNSLIDIKCRLFKNIFIRYKYNIFALTLTLNELLNSTYNTSKQNIFYFIIIMNNFITLFLFFFFF